ncbi:hypothetical protein KTR66_09715 [Roseococcus sp. SDR]|uniref:PP_RS20740 family protein n=1 Tax=Roseococcus sp. SDR TaxID=2835532 RepID=UPI001BD122B3|nr:hypothetical protein [Roseococcus sp. SDR]MBS7790273.1 hypothetical protein [Roseococcus sp. SDR]MBV1845587.1 hypothetical protein [Roseococcus sp. SDR]
MSEVDREIEDAYGPLDDAAVQPQSRRRREFAPWHHPVKQVVRARQWAEQIERLIGDGHVTRGVLRYLTLPGADMMDARYIGGRLRSRGDGPFKLEVFGFDRSAGDTDGPGSPGEEALAALRQDQLATMESKLRVGQIEEIAVDGSVAQRQLQDAGAFDVINLDACSHLCCDAPGEARTLFAALQKLMVHQLQRRDPWLLFVTTRAAAGDFRGHGADTLKSIVKQNIEHDGPAFIDGLRAVTGLDQQDGGASAAWAADGELFLKMFTVGLGKHLLHFFNNQIGRSARVDLTSVFGYRVSGDEPDMLALAFRVSPRDDQPVTAARVAAVAVPQPEIEEIKRMLRRAACFRNLDSGIETMTEVRTTAIREQAELLAAANYPIEGWVEWLKTHNVRPMDCAWILQDAQA